MTKSNNKTSGKTDVQVIIEHVDDQLAKVVESVKILHEISMKKMQHMSDRLEKVEMNSAWTKLNLSTMQHDVKMLKLRSDKAADEYADMKSEVKSHDRRLTKLEAA